MDAVEENKDSFIYTAVRCLILRKEDSLKIMRWILRLNRALDYSNSAKQSVQQLIEVRDCFWVADKIREADRFNTRDVKLSPELGNKF